ncbi:MAG: DUF2066 domain-containing protein [Colwellia sp.]|nr:DUF2066 domain-containing protein [Colwellia sp.]MCW9081486.1 DUF2066 domain-containing protein [Colwellia sp.]
MSLTPVQALEVKDLYQASVAINSQTSRDRSAALKDALAIVMIKVGGEKSVLENAVLKKALKNHQQYLTQYRYQQKAVRVDKAAVEQHAPNQRQLFLLASFNEEKINNLFQQANLPLWGSLRPQVLLWLIDEQGFTRTIMSNSTDSALPYMVNEFSARRGLPIMMPLMDLTDASQITISDIWGRFEQPIREASSRYYAEAIVVMRISNSSLKISDSFAEQEKTSTDATPENCGLLCIQPNSQQQDYVLDWSLITAQQTFSQQYQGSDRQILLQQGLGDITEIIYQHYALSTSSSNDFVIEVANVDSLNTYMQVFNFLDDLSAVKSVTLVSAKGESRRFQLQLLGSVDALLASLKLNKQLKQYIDPLAELNTGTQLTPVFYWGGK